MAFAPIDLSIFPKERETALKAIWRYSRFELVYYRSNLWMHAHRMLWMVEELAPLVQTYFHIDIDKARTLTLVHDDAEMLAGNVSILESIMFYARTFALFPQKYPLLKDFMNDTSSPLTYIEDRADRDHVPASHYARLMPYTRESIANLSDLPFYNEWKRIVIARGGDEGIEWLTKQREFPKSV